MPVDDLNYAHVRLSPPPEAVDKYGKRWPIAPAGALGVCQLRVDVNVPDLITVIVPYEGSYTIDLERNRLHVESLSEQDVATEDGGYQLKAKVRLLGFRIVVNPHQTRDGNHIWLEPTAEEQGAAVEVEQEAEEGTTLTEPYDPRLIRVDPKIYSLRNVVDMIEDGDLELAPDFQRMRVWKPYQKSRLIESILLRIPVPAFYFSADTEGRMQVVDGLQRLSTVYSFVTAKIDREDTQGKGGFALSELEYLRNLDGKTFTSLAPEWKRRVQSTQIFANVIDPQTPATVKFDIFKRINTLGSPLNAQEIRHCISNKRAREFLKRCTASKEFQLATGNKMRDDERMADREVALRFSAFRLIARTPEEYGPTTQLDDFLTKATVRLGKELPDATLTRLEEEFIRAMDNAYRLFREHAFRKWKAGEERTNPINKALFESWAVALADYEWNQLQPYAATIVERARHAMAYDANYDLSITYGTGDSNRVRKRLKVAGDILREVVGPPGAGTT
jgi:hypothetical protein